MHSMMQITQTKLFRALLGVTLIVVCLSFLRFSFRWTAWALFLLLLVAYIHFLWRSTMRWMPVIFAVFLITIFLPVDVSLNNYPGPPRFVPLIMGAPTDDDVAREQRGEAVLGGCILRGNEPRWVLVW
jgi:hypothetical protein